VTECYSVAGPYDLVAIVRVREHEQLSDLVTEQIASHPGITATETLIAFRSLPNAISAWFGTSAPIDVR